MPGLTGRACRWVRPGSIRCCSTRSMKPPSNGSRAPATFLRLSFGAPQEWLRFLNRMPSNLGIRRDEENRRRFHLTGSRNDEILAEWLLMAAKNNYEPAYPKLAQFLETVGRRKYIKPIYEELAKTPERTRARSAHLPHRPAGLPPDSTNHHRCGTQIVDVGYNGIPSEKGPIAQLVRALP